MIEKIKNFERGKIYKIMSMKIELFVKYTS